MLSSNEPSQSWSWVLITASIYDAQENLADKIDIKNSPGDSLSTEWNCSLFCMWDVQLMEGQSTACDGASAGCTGTSTHNASPRETAVLSTKLYCLPYTVLLLSAGKIPCCWAPHPIWEASSSIFAEQEDLLHVSLSHKLTAPQRCISRLRDLVWMYREFLSCSSRGQPENGEQHLGNYFKDRQAPALALAVPAYPHRKVKQKSETAAQIHKVVLNVSLE